MSQIKIKDNAVNTNGELPPVGSVAPSFTLSGNDLKEVSSDQFRGKRIILNIYPSVDTGTCAKSTREFNQRAASADNTIIICVSKDLPFAFRRFCGAEGIDKVLTLSDFRNKGFAKDYGVEMIDGNMVGLFARAIVVIDGDGKVIHTELVPVIGQEPNYEAALHAK